MPPPGALNPSTAVGEYFINSISLNTVAWNVLTIIPLIDNYPATRGDNVVISGIPGQVAYPMEIEQTDYVLPMMVSGAVDENGDEDDDGYFACLFRNFAKLRSGIYGPVDGATATWASSLVTPWGDTYEADVQVLDVGEVYANTSIVKTNLTVRVPAGEYTLIPAGS